MDKPMIQTPTPGGKIPTNVLSAAKLPFKLETASHVNNYLNLLVYGPYGVGKTSLAATALEVPEMNDVLLISAEHGDQSIAGEDALMLEGLQKPLDCTKLDLIKITDFEMFARVADFLKLHCQLRDANNIEGLKKLEASYRGVEPSDIIEPRRWRTVINDSLTEIDTYCMYRLLNVSDDYKLDEDIANTEFAHYKKNNMMMLRVIRAFRDLPMHVISTCAEQYGQDEQKKYRYTPYLTGKLSSQAQAYMDMVGYYVRTADPQGGEIRRLMVKPPISRTFDAKHRYPKFKGAAFDNPTMGKILKQCGLI